MLGRWPPMDNPFDEIAQRLERIERMLEERSPVLNPLVNIPIAEKPITQTELCKHLRVTAQTIIRWRRKKRIPFLQVGSAVRFNLPEVMKALEKK